MNEEYVNKCEEIFEKRCEIKCIREKIERMQVCFELEISTEYQYILESYAGVYIRENYVFMALEKNPIVDKNGFNRVSFFSPFEGRNNIFELYEMYKTQLPIELIPIAEMDGGNLLCLSRITKGIYIWIHDKNGKNIYLVQKNISDFIFSFEKMIYKEDIDLGIVETKFSPSFLNALKNYKK